MQRQRPPPASALSAYNTTFDTVHGATRGGRRPVAPPVASQTALPSGITGQPRRRRCTGTAVAGVSCGCAGCFGCVHRVCGASGASRQPGRMRPGGSGGFDTPHWLGPPPASARRHRQPYVPSPSWAFGGRLSAAQCPHSGCCTARCGHDPNHAQRRRSSGRRRSNVTVPVRASAS